MAHTLWDNFVSPTFTSLTGHSGGYQVGHGCIFNRDGRVSGVRFWAGSTVTAGVTYTVKLWEMTGPTAGTAIATKAVLGSTITANQWNSVLFDAPVDVETRKAYQVTVHRTGSDTYASTFRATEPGGLYFGKVAGQKAETPHHADFEITDAIDVRIELFYEDITVDGFFYTLASKMNEAGLHTCWILELRNNIARPRFWATNDGGSEFGIFGQASNGELTAHYGSFYKHAIRVVYDPNNGAGQKSWKFYHAPSIATGDSSGWTQLGTTITFSGATTLFNDATVPVRIGNAATNDEAFAGQVCRFQVRDGEGGTIVTDVDFTRHAFFNQTEVIDDTGKVYTISGGAFVVDGVPLTEADNMLYGWYHGEVITHRLGTVEVVDNFTRTPQVASWGTPDTGAAWGSAGTVGGDLSTEAGYGVHTIDTEGETVGVRDGSADRTSELVTIRNLHVDETPTVSVRQMVFMRRFVDFVRASVRWNPDGTADLELDDTDGGSTTPVVIPGVTASQPVDMHCRLIGQRLLVWAARSSVGLDIESAPLATMFTTVTNSGTTDLISLADAGESLPKVARWGDIEIVDLDGVGSMAQPMPQGLTTDFSSGQAATVFPTVSQEVFSQGYFVSPLFEAEAGELETVASAATLSMDGELSASGVLDSVVTPAEVSMNIVEVTEATLDTTPAPATLSMDGLAVYGTLDTAASRATIEIEAFNTGEPGYDDSTERIYRTLPEFYRRADVTVFWQFKKWLTGIGFELNKLDQMIDRFKYTTRDSGGEADDTSDLTDPMTADLAWLPWLAQHVGAVINPSLSEADQRLAILQRLTDDNQQPGTKGSIANAARTNLTGTRSVNVYDHSSDVGTPGSAGPWDVLIVTVGSETPGGVDPIADVIAAHAKPAGVILYHRTFESVWDDIEAALATWDDWEAAGSWREIEETGL